ENFLVRVDRLLLITSLCVAPGSPQESRQRPLPAAESLRRVRPLMDRRGGMSLAPLNVAAIEAEIAFDRQRRRSVWTNRTIVQALQNDRGSTLHRGFGPDEGACGCEHAASHERHKGPERAAQDLASKNLWKEPGADRQALHVVHSPMQLGFGRPKVE